MVEVPVKLYMDKLAKKAKEAARPLSFLDGKVKAAALHAMAERLLEQETEVLEANRKDIDQVGKALEGETSRERVREAVDRVTLTPEDLKKIAEIIHTIADLPDPVGEVTGMWTRPNGMQVSRVRTPIGVIAVISDFGPKVSVEALVLCLKSGNACVLRASPDWNHSNQVIFALLREAAEQAGVPVGAISLVERTEREAALELLRLPKLIDAIIPRGGAGLRKVVTEQARMPVLCHDGGVGYVYADAEADLPMAQNIVVNSKAQETTASNSVDTLLVHLRISRTFLPGLVRRLLDEYKVDVYGCTKTMALTGDEEFPAYKATRLAGEKDWGQQYLSPTIAIKVVDDMDAALDHINRHGPVHTASIVTRDYAAAMRFTEEVDAGTVAVNISTRLHDGHEYGLGGQMGVSTARVHARGPLALDELTCQKYVVLGNGQLRHPHPVFVAYEDALILKPHP
jgi:glutamate-5-semialdehyde dehydrogenase